MEPRSGLATTPNGLRIGSLAGASGEWMHYVAATWLAFSIGGTRMVALYLVAVALPGTFVRRRWPGARFLPPAGVLALAVLSERNLDPLTLTLLGLGVGTGAALSGRATAWPAGLVAPPTWPGVAGAAAAVGLNAAFGVGFTLLGSAALLGVASVFPGEGRAGGQIQRPLVPAATGLAFVVGLRVLEPALGGDPSGAGALAAMWAAGAQLGWLASARMDARIVLAAPFAAGAAVAGLGALDGSARLLPYLGVGVCVGVVAGVAGSNVSLGESLWPKPRMWLVAGLAVGAAWGVRQGNSLEAASAGAAVAVLAGGFISVAAARRFRIPQRLPEKALAVAKLPRRAAIIALPRRRPPAGARIPSPPRAPRVAAALRPLGVPTSVIEAPREPAGVTNAAAELQAALHAATSLRLRALNAYAVSGMNAVERARFDIRRVAEEILSELGPAADRIRRLGEAD